MKQYIITIGKQLDFQKKLTGNKHTEKYLKLITKH